MGKEGREATYEGSCKSLLWADQINKYTSCFVQSPLLLINLFFTWLSCVSASLSPGVHLSNIVWNHPQETILVLDLRTKYKIASYLKIFGRVKYITKNITMNLFPLYFIKIFIMWEAMCKQSNRWSIVLLSWYSSVLLYSSYLLVKNL